MSDVIAMTEEERRAVREALMKIQCAEPRAPVATLTRRAQLDRVEITTPAPSLVQLLLPWLLPTGFMAMVIGTALAYTVRGLAGWLGTL